MLAKGRIAREAWMGSAPRHPHITESQATNFGRAGGAAALRNPARSGMLRGFLHPLLGVNMWRGNHNKYKYTRQSVGRFGEGGAMSKYHQYFSHAKDPADSRKAGREYEYFTVERGKTKVKPLPEVQYAHKDSKPTWLFKSWTDGFDQMDNWQREVQYPEHIPTHLGSKRPLSVLAPSTAHTHLQLAFMNKLTVTVCPFVFGFGHTAQKTALDFFRLAISSRCQFPKDKIFLFYSMDAISPRIEVEWLNGQVYSPTIYERMSPGELVQQVMERAWLQGDIIASAGAVLPAIPVDDYKWHEVVSFKKKKKASGAGKDAKKK